MRYEGKMSPRQSKSGGDTQKLREGELTRNHPDFLKTGSRPQMHQKRPRRESVSPRGGDSHPSCPLARGCAVPATKGLRFGHGVERSALSAANPVRAKGSAGRREGSGGGRRGLPPYRGGVQLRLSQLRHRSPRTSCQLRAGRIAAPGPQRGFGEVCKLAELPSAQSS